MQVWNLVFHPPKGEKNSPVDRLASEDCSARDRANIMGKLTQLQNLKRIDWPYKWAKPIDEFLELKHGDFRVFYQVVEGTIVVCHVCRKVSQKAKKADIEAARTNMKDYKSGVVDEE